MLTKPEFAALLAGANQGLLALVIATLAALALVLALGRLFRIRIALPYPVLFPPRLGIIVSLGTVLRLVSMFSPAWYDETFTARIASQPLSALPAAIAGDVHPPLFYLLDWVTVHLFGVNPWGLRLIPLVFGVLTILMIYRLALLLNLSTVGAHWAALIAAGLPSLIYYSVEARGYSLLVYLVVYALAALLSDHKKTFVVTTALIPLTHNLGYFYAAMLGLIALWQYRRAVIRPLIVASVAPLMWLPTMMAQAKDVSDGFWLGSIDRVGPALIARDFFDATMTTRISPALVIPAYVLTLLMTVLAGWYLRFWLRQHWQITALGLGVPALVLVVSLLWHDIFLARALLPCAALLGLVWAALIDRHRRALYGVLPLLIAGLIGFYSHGDLTPDIGPQFAVCDGRAIYATDIPAAMFAGYYLPNQEISIWPQAGDLNQSLSQASQRAMGFSPRTLDRLAGPVCVVSFQTPLTGAAEQAFVSAVAFRADADHHTEINQTWHINIYTLEQ